MAFRKEIWTYLIVTAVTVVIWFLAAGATRSQEVLNARLHFEVAESARWIVSPEQRSVQINIEGSRLSIERARDAARRGVRINLPATVGRETIDLLELLRMSDLPGTGVGISAVEPSLIEIERDEIVTVSARVRAPLPGVQTEGEITIEPAEVSVSMPSAVRDRIAGEITVEAAPDRTQIERLQPGLRHELQDVALRLTEPFATNANIAIHPSTVKLGFAIRSRTRETTLDSVRIQLAGPPEDYKEYVVEVGDTILRNVTIIADGDLIRRIEAGEARVVGMLHLDSREKERGIEEKAVSYFLAMIPDGPDKIVEARVEGVDNPPIVRLHITRTDSE